MIELTTEIMKKIIDLVRSGSYIDIACLSYGISLETYKGWMEAAEDAPDSNYGQLQQAIRRAEAEAEARNVAIIQKAASENWQASMWWLENRYPGRWGRGKMLRGRK